MREALTETEYTGLRYTFEKQKTGGRMYTLVALQPPNETLLRLASAVGRRHSRK